MVNKIQYTPFINKNERSTLDVKPLLTTSRSEVILPVNKIQNTEIEPYKPQFELTPQKQRGKISFKSPDINIGNTKDLLNQFEEAGINLRITSGFRPGAKTKQGNDSWHGKGFALDVTPEEGQTFDDLKAALKVNPQLVEWMQKNGYGIIDETTPEVLKKTGGTGAHWHIGKDKLAQEGLLKLLLKQGGRIPKHQNGAIYKPYIIKRGENLSNIANTLGIPLGTLASINNIQNVDRVYAGQELKVPTFGYQPQFNLPSYMKEPENIKDYPTTGVELRPDQVAEVERNERINDIIGRAKAKGQEWDSSMVDYVEKTLGNHRVPLDVIYDLIDTEGGWKVDIKNPHSSASGLFQVIGGTAKGLFGDEVAKEYANQTRSFHNQIRDAVKLLDVHTRNIPDDELDYGRVKIAMLGPSYKLDQIIPNHVYNNSLSDKIKRIVPRGSTFHTLRDAYNSGIKN